MASVFLGDYFRNYFRFSALFGSTVGYMTVSVYEAGFCWVTVHLVLCSFVVMSSCT